MIPKFISKYEKQIKKTCYYSNSMIQKNIVAPSRMTIFSNFHSSPVLKDQKSFKDMLKKMQETQVNENKEDKEAEKSENMQNSDAKTKEEAPKIDINETIGLIRYRLTDFYYNLVDNIKLAYAEMIGEDKESQLTRKVQQASNSYKKSSDTDEESEAYTGGTALVHVKDPQNAWETMKARLSDSPFIKEILKNSRKFTKTAAETPLGQQVSQINESIKGSINSAKEVWETSQNPLVYTVSGVIENLTGETEEGLAIQDIRRLDPKFNKEDWSEEVLATLVPLVLGAHLRGDINALKPWLKTPVFNKLAAEIRLRKSDGIVFDPNLLDISENRIIIKHLETEGAVIVGIYSVQQIHCIKNRKGEIIEGSETDIRAKFYSIAFQIVYNEEESVAEWKVVDYQFAGETPYY